MKTLIVVATLLCSPALLASCYERLTQDYSRDSHAYQLSEDAVDYELERGTVEFARAAITALEASLDCGMEADSKLIGKANCSEVVPGVAMSRVCYIENHNGYFLVSVDMLENINIVFNRFD